MFPPAKIYASELPARQAPMIHGIELWLCSGRSSVRFGGFASFGGADVPSLSAALTGGRNIPYPPEAVRASFFAGRQRLHARPPPFLILRFLLRYPFNMCRLRWQSCFCGPFHRTACGFSAVCLISVIDDSTTSMSSA